MNKKLLLNTFVFQMVGAIVFVITFLLTFFGVISKNNTLVNGMIFAVSAMACLSWYAFVTNKYCNSVNIKDCVLLIIISSVLGSPMILIGLKMVGIHLSVTVIWIGAALLIFANSIINILQEKDDLVDYQNKKYTYIISKLKLWKFFVAFGPYLFGFVNVFIPLDFTSV